MNEVEEEVGLLHSFYCTKYSEDEVILVFEEQETLLWGSEQFSCSFIQDLHYQKQFIALLLWFSAIFFFFCFIEYRS